MEFAEQIPSASYTTVRAWATDGREPDPADYEHLMKMFEVTLEQLGSMIVLEQHLYFLKRHPEAPDLR